jgi:hypothetical protein
MVVRVAINEWLSIILKLGIIAVIIIGVAWFFVSVWANVQEGTAELPEVQEAKYMVFVKATGATFLTDAYEQNGTIYTLRGLYHKIDGRWRYNDNDFLIDTSKWGEITIKRRVTP